MQRWPAQLNPQAKQATDFGVIGCRTPGLGSSGTGSGVQTHRTCTTPTGVAEVENLLSNGRRHGLPRGRGSHLLDCSFNRTLSRSQTLGRRISVPSAAEVSRGSPAAMAMRGSNRDMDLLPAAIESGRESTPSLRAALAVRGVIAVAAAGPGALHAVHVDRTVKGRFAGQHRNAACSRAHGRRPRGASNEFTTTLQLAGAAAATAAERFDVPGTRTPGLTKSRACR
jgi:hypothetical protein